MKPKDSGMRIRVEKELRDAFVRSCRDQNQTAANVLRDFMRTYTEQQVQGQGNLFAIAKQK